MCGIAGVFVAGGERDDDLMRLTLQMTQAITHRGPDSSGIWVEGSSGIALGHRRLSIVDVSPSGAQPMVSESGRYVLSYNGEIYNHLKVRQDLDSIHGCRWRGRSDTEVLLAAIDNWGLDQTLPRLNGMFAFALWDRVSHLLTLGRDRFGEKPLYYGTFGRTLIFGSELRALRRASEWEQVIDRNSLALLMRHSAIPAPYSIFQGVRKLEPASVVSFSDDGRGRVAMGAPRKYWDLPEVVSRGTRLLSEASEENQVAEIEQALSTSVQLRMQADVPLGAFLSGGVDSSLIVALMQQQSSQPVKTFTIGFSEPGYDEAPYARQIAEHLGTDHLELYVSAEDARAVIPKLPSIYDEPFADSSQIPTFLVSHLARQKVAVSLSGDGGDESFGGYNRHVTVEPMWRRVEKVPRWARALAAKGIRLLSQDQWSGLANRMRPLLPRRLQRGLLGEQLYKGISLLEADSAWGVYRSLVSHWNDPEALVLGAKEPATMLTDLSKKADWRHVLSTIMLLDSCSYLPDDILVKVDRASMAVSLESRAPYLDHSLVELAWRLPTSLKVRDGKGKWILRKILRRHVPERMFDRPKAGFGMPIDRWLRGPLREWSESLINESRLKQEGFFDPALVTSRWHEHLSGVRNWHHHLWNILMFQQWREADG